MPCCLFRLFLRPLSANLRKFLLLIVIFGFCGVRTTYSLSMSLDSSDTSRGARPVLRDLTNEPGKKRGLSLLLSPSKNEDKNGKRVALGVENAEGKRPAITDKENSNSSEKQVHRRVENHQVQKHYVVDKENNTSFVKRVPLRLLDDNQQVKAQNVAGKVKGPFGKESTLVAEDIATGGPSLVDKGSDHLSLDRGIKQAEKSAVPSAKTVSDVRFFPLKGGKAYRLQSQSSPQAAKIGIAKMTTPETKKKPIFVEDGSVSPQEVVSEIDVQGSNKGYARENCIASLPPDESPRPPKVIQIDDGGKSQGDDGRELPEFVQRTATKEASQFSEGGKSPGGSYVSYSISGSVIGPRLTEFQQSKSFELTKCSGLKDDGCSSLDAGCDSVKGCSCSFCKKAAYIWSDLYYQDIKGRISAFMKSRREASNLVKKIEHQEIARRGQGSSSRLSNTEAELLHEWKSLFHSMEDIFVKESNQLEPSFLALKDLRDNCKMNLETTNGNQ